MTDPSDALHEGSCLCGTVRWRVRGELRPVIACHCGQCRKMSGHFWAATSASHDQFELTGKEEPAWYRSSEAAERGFCRKCGSTLFWQPTGEARIAIAAGSIDGPSGLETSEHIYVANKGDYYEIGDGKPQLAAW